MRTHGRTLGAVAALLAIGALLGAGGGQGAPGDPTGLLTNHPDSGIRGRVVLGPTCPLQRIGQSCVRPYQTKITIRVEPSGRLAARVRSSTDGRFTVALAPGRYRLVPQMGRPYPRSSPQMAAVVAIATRA